MKSNLIASVIVTYNPNDSVHEVLFSAATQSDLVIVIDNGSEQHVRNLIFEVIGDVRRKLSVANNEKFIVIFNQTNLGIAEGLNQGAAIALRSGMDFVLFLDQDSRIAEECVRNLHQAYLALEIKMPLGALFAKNVDQSPRVLESLQMVYYNRMGAFHTEKLQEVFLAQTSGTFIRLRILVELGFLRSDYFIDEVDHEFCFRLRKKGYKLVVVNDAIIFHTLGQVITIHIGMLRISYTSHMPIRYYYKIRNIFMVTEQYAPYYFTDSILSFMTVILKLCIETLFSKNRLLTMRYSFHGLEDFLRQRTGKIDIIF